MWEWTARSAYGIKGARAHHPQCRPKADNPSEGDCEAPSNQTGDDYHQSDAERAFFPFEVAGAPAGDKGALEADWLRKGGMAGPTDGEAEGYARTNEFLFHIVEGDRYSEFAQNDEGAAALSPERVGQPPAGYIERGEDAGPTTQELWIQAWPNEPVDPNRTHLLVLALYEIRQVRDIEYQQHRSGADASVVFRQPVWQIRRVLYRVVVEDLSATSGGNALSNLMDDVGNAISSSVDGIKNLVPNLWRSFIQWMVTLLTSGGEEPMRVVCVGGDGLAGVLGEPDIAQLGQARVRDGAVEVSVSRDAELQGRKNCEHRVERLPVAVAAPVAPMECDVQQVLRDGVCWGIPKPELERYQTKWVLPGCPDPGGGPCAALQVDANNAEY